MGNAINRIKALMALALMMGDKFNLSLAAKSISDHVNGRVGKGKDRT